MTSAPHLSLDNVCVTRTGRTLVSGLSLEIPRGSFVAIVGASGVGKSTLLACLAGMLEPGSGKITYRSEAQGLHAPQSFQRHLGLVFQHLRLIRNASALTNVLCGLLGDRPWWRTLFGFSRADRQRAASLLADLELVEQAKSPIAKLSGGECQRVAIARALMQSPEFVLADEPVSHLDPRLARKILTLLKEQTRSHARSVFCVLHDPALVEEFADLTLSLDRNSPTGWSLRAATP